jgi:ribosomal-protein-serine acetyltransferase
MFPLTAGVTSQGAPIEIRVFEDTHAEELFRLINANRTSLSQWLPWLDWSNLLTDTETHIRNSLERYQDRHGFAAGIWIGGTLGGSIGLHAIDTRHRSCCIGFWLVENFRGGGIMTRACREVVDQAFDYYHLHRVEIRCATGNFKSSAVAQRLGFFHEGVLREAEWLYDHFVDLNVYGMLEHDWRE